MGSPSQRSAPLTAGDTGGIQGQCLRAPAQDAVASMLANAGAGRFVGTHGVQRGNFCWGMGGGRGQCGETWLKGRRCGFAVGGRAASGRRVPAARSHGRLARSSTSGELLDTCVPPRPSLPTPTAYARGGGCHGHPISRGALPPTLPTTSALSLWYGGPPGSHGHCYRRHFGHHRPHRSHLAATRRVPLSVQPRRSTRPPLPPPSSPSPPPPVSGGAFNPPLPRPPPPPSTIGGGRRGVGAVAPSTAVASGARGGSRRQPFGGVRGGVCGRPNSGEALGRFCLVALARRGFFLF